MKLDPQTFIDALWGARLDFDPKVFNFKRMDTTERIGPRTLEHHQINYVVKGKIDGIADGARFQCPQGSLLWLAPGTPHEMIYPKGMVFYYYRFLPSRIGAEGKKEDLSIPEAWLLRKDARLLFPLVQSIVLEFLADETFRLARIKAGIIAVCVELLRDADNRATAGARFTRAEQIRLIEYIKANLVRRESPQELAKRFGLSYDYFARKFRNTFGLSPISWMVRERIERSFIPIIDGDESITSIAERLGYEDLYYFSRQFKRVVGRSPEEFRREHRYAGRRD